MKSIKILASAAMVAAMTAVAPAPAYAGVKDRVEFCKYAVEIGYIWDSVGKCVGNSFNWKGRVIARSMSTMASSTPSANA